MLVFYIGLEKRLPDKCFDSIYFAFVYPHLFHGIEVYANTRPTHFSKLLILNNNILRILQNKLYRSPVKDLYTAYNTLPIPSYTFSSCYSWCISVFITRICYLRYFLDYFHDIYTIYSHDTRQKPIFLGIA